MTGFRHGMLAAVLSFLAFPVQVAKATACETNSFAGADYTICTVDAAKGNLQLFWKNEDGHPYRNFTPLAEAIAKRGQTLVFAVNAGMYQPDFSPMGLFVSEGNEQSPVHPAKADETEKPVPNFYKKPNGVFYLDESGVGILPTKRFLELRPKVRLATQSGPMLVIRGRINPIFIVGSTDKTRRSGVGVCENDAIRFAVSEDAVNFHDFARLFRDHLNCPNALFLDGGGGTGLYDPALGRNDFSWHGGYGPMLGLVE